MNEALLEKIADRFTQDAETAMMLDAVEGQLREQGHVGQAESLLKFQQDITAWQAGAGTASPQSGELIDPFIKAYTEITPARMADMLKNIEDLNLLGGEIKSQFQDFRKDCMGLIPPVAPSYAARAGRPPGPR